MKDKEKQIEILKRDKSACYIMKNNMQICFTGANIMKKALENPRLL